MKYCVKCGTGLNDDAVFCSVCGTSTVAVQDPSNNRGMARFFSIIAYFSPFWLIGLLVGPYKRNPIVRRHVGQGIILAIVDTIFVVVGAIINGCIGFVFGFMSAVFDEPALGVLGTLFSMPVTLTVWAISVVFIIIGVVNAAKLQEKNLPIIGRFAFYK